MKQWQIIATVGLALQSRRCPIIECIQCVQLWRVYHRSLTNDYPENSPQLSNANECDRTLQGFKPIQSMNRRRIP